MTTTEEVTAGYEGEVAEFSYTNQDLTGSLDLMIAIARDVGSEDRDRKRARTAAKSIQMILADLQKSAIKDLDI